METPTRNYSEKSIIIHAPSDLQAINEVRRRSPETAGIKIHGVDRIRRTFWQRLTKSSPKWKVTYTEDTKSQGDTNK